MKNYETNVTVPSGSIVTGDFNWIVPEGYIIASATIMNGSSYVFTEFTSISSGNFKAYNKSTSDKEVTARARVIFVKNL